MYKNRGRLQQIISRYLTGKSTKGESEFLDAYDDLFSSNTTNIDVLNNTNREQLEKKLERNVLNIIEAQDSKKVVPLWVRIAVAASVCAVLAAGLFLSNNRTHNQLSVVEIHKIEPGSNKAILILANGSEIYLANAKNGQIAAQGSVNIIKAANGSVAYQADAGNTQADAQLAINTVATPYGGQYQVNLPDGSRVWLNAASSLAFPVSFDGARNREVTLKGEAYFEVAKDKEHPFIVKTSTQQVRVLGTHFNINAYADEPYTMTTLLEGSVKVSSNNGNDATMLVPGQQSNYEERRFAVKDVVAEDAIAWKQGYFRFNDESFEEALKKIARWYNVTIVYTDNDIKNETAYGTMSRFSSITDVVQLLELTKVARFKIENDKIIVSKYTN